MFLCFVAISSIDDNNTNNKMAFDLKEYLPSLETIFAILKYFLIVCNALVIIGSLFVLLTGRDLNEPEFKNHHGVMVFACLTLILFCTLGIVSVYRKHFALTLTYAILMTIALLMEVAELSREDTGSFFASALIVLAAYGYAFMIHQHKREEELRRTFSHQTAKI